MKNLKHAGLWFRVGEVGAHGSKLSPQTGGPFIGKDLSMSVDAGLLGMVDHVHLLPVDECCLGTPCEVANPVVDVSHSTCPVRASLANSESLAVAVMAFLTSRRGFR